MAPNLKLASSIKIKEFLLGSQRKMLEFGLILLSLSIAQLKTLTDILRKVLLFHLKQKRQYVLKLKFMEYQLICLKRISQDQSLMLRNHISSLTL